MFRATQSRRSRLLRRLRQIKPLLRRLRNARGPGMLSGPFLCTSIPNTAIRSPRSAQVPSRRSLASVCLPRDTRVGVCAGLLHMSTLPEKPLTTWMNPLLASPLIGRTSLRSRRAAIYATLRAHHSSAETSRGAGTSESTSRATRCAIYSGSVSTGPLSPTLFDESLIPD